MYGALRSVTARSAPSPPLAQHRRLEAAAASDRAGQPDRRPVRHQRQPIQPRQPGAAGVAGRPSPHPAGVHPHRRVLAQPAGGLVAAGSPRGPCRAELRRPCGDHPGHPHRHRPAQRPRPPVGVGPPTTPTLPTPRLYLPDLRNVALSLPAPRPIASRSTHQPPTRARHATALDPASVRAWCRIGTTGVRRAAGRSTRRGVARPGCRREPGRHAGGRRCPPGRRRARRRGQR